MSVRSEVLLWASRVLARKKDTDPQQILEIKPDAGLDDAQAAFHKVARFAHPDLHRSSLTPDELELVTSAYSRVAGAYQDMRAHRTQTTRMRSVNREAPLKTDPPPPSSSPSQASSGASAMSSRALVYYRKAELALRRGDLRGAVLQLKMAIAADPLSQFLRSALVEVETEVKKK